MEKISNTIFKFGFICFVIVVICMVIFGMYRDITDLRFCKSEGYEHNSYKTISKIRYVECCNDVITEKGFEKDCKIFPK